jgi:transposase
MSQSFLNKFEKKQRVIESHVQGLTIREISKIVKMSFRDISKIIKAYDKKIELETKKRENNQESTTKKLSLSSKAFILYQEGKQIEKVKVLLDISFKLAIRYWKQYLRSIRMFEAFEFYQVCQHDLPSLLIINNFIKNNHININNIAEIMKIAKDIIGLQLQISILKYEIENLQKIKNNLQHSQDNYALKTVSELNLNYPKYHI